MEKEEKEETKETETVNENKKNKWIVIVLVALVVVVCVFVILTLTGKEKTGNSSNEQHTDFDNGTDVADVENGDSGSDVSSTQTNESDIREILKGNWANVTEYYTESMQCMGDGYAIFTAGDNVIMGGKFHIMQSHNVGTITSIGDNKYEIIDDNGDKYITVDVTEASKGILKIGNYTYKLINRESVSKDTVAKTICNGYVKSNNVETFATGDNGYGEAIVTGYAYTEERTDSDTGEKFQYVLFKITESSSDNFMKYIESMKGNSYVSDKAIGLGCLKDGIISYNNASNDNSGKGENYTLSSVDSIKIINSSSSNLIKLDLLKNKLTTGSSGYNCSSLITRISVINN